MSKGLIALIVVALIVAFSFGQYVTVRNTLVTKNEAVKAAWSQVDIVLERRADLIPNLVETVKGYARRSKPYSAISPKPVPLCFPPARRPTRLPPTASLTALSAVCC